MNRNDSMIPGLENPGKNLKADLYASFEATRLQLAELREKAERDDSPEAKDSHKDISHFVAKFEENGLWDYLVKLRDVARAGTSDSNPVE